MTWALLVVVAAITVASRVLPMTLLPVARGRLAEVLDALPPPLFAVLAAYALVGDGTPSLQHVMATGGALLGATRRSLALALVCGMAGFALGHLLSG